MLPLRTVPMATALLLGLAIPSLSQAQDHTPPAPITDLLITSTPDHLITLSWTATGDDGMAGIAQSYDLHYSTNPIDEGNFWPARYLAFIPVSGAAGTPESYLIQQPEPPPGAFYYFAIKVLDEAGNWSLISNVVSIFVPEEADRMPPATITDLQVLWNSDGTFTAYWRGSGDDGYSNGPAAAYDCRYSRAPITAENFQDAWALPGEPVPAGSGEYVRWTFEALVSAETYFALKSIDNVGNVSELSNVAFIDFIDDTPPAAISNLEAMASPYGHWFLWTETGDDGASGRCASYSLRYATSPITEATWAAATQVPGETSPQRAGLPFQVGVPVSSIPAGALYYCAVKATDDAGNVSALSNIAVLDLIPPAAMTDLRAVRASSTSVDLMVTAPGDDGYSGMLDYWSVQYSTQPFTPPGWPPDYDGRILPLVAGGTSARFTVDGLQPGTTYYFSVLASDGGGNIVHSNLALGITRRGILNAKTAD